MLIEVLSIGLLVLLGSAWLTGYVRRLALVHDLVDVPNARSSHVNPTPRGGGIAIVAASMVGLAVFAYLGEMPYALFWALMGGGAAVATVGFLDDRFNLPPKWRILVHFVAALWALLWLGGFPELDIGNYSLHLGWFGYVAAAFGIVWVLNLFNFMDGIDGVAASEATFVFLGGAGFALAAGVGHGLFGACLIFGAASCGFLLWNWPPAKIFMGDVGSGFLGYVLAVLAISFSQEYANGLWIWLTLGAVFFIDATVTLARRCLRGEPVCQPHRNHAYQRLSRRWRSHGRVTILVLLIDLLWLFPFACWGLREPGYAVWLFAIAAVPLCLGVFFVALRESEH